MTCLDLTIDNYNEALNDHEVLVIHFCIPNSEECLEFAPIYEQVMTNHPDIVFAKVDTTKHEAVAAKFAVREIPTIAVAKEGIVVYKEDGVMLSEEDVNYVLKQVKNLDMAAVRAELAQDASKSSE